MNVTIENLRTENQSLNNRIAELENQIIEQVNLEELKAIVGELKTLINILGKEHFLIYEDGDVEYIYPEKNNY